MLNLVIGLGVQGSKRVRFLKENFITVDPIKKKQIIKTFQKYL